MYDAIIIGAGLGSLTAAAKLSLNAKKILLIEKNSHIGGAAGSFKVNNFNFDVSLHNFGPYNENTKLYTIFKELGIDKKLNFIPFKSYQKIIFPDIELDMEKGFSNFTDYLINIFPDEAKGIKKIIKIAGKIFSEFNEFQNSKIGIDEIESREPAFPMLYPNITFLSHKTLEDFLSDHIKDKKLKGILGNLWWLFGIPPDELSAVLYLSPFFGYFEYGGGLFNGTSQSIIDALADIIKSNKGEIKTDLEISQILINDSEEITGVMDINNNIYNSKIVISGIGADVTFNKILNSNTKEKNKISEVTQSLSALSVYIGINKDPKSLNINNHAVSLFSSYDNKENYKYSCDNDFNNSTLLINIPSLYDNVNPGFTSINLFTLCSSSKYFDKKDALDTLLNRLFSIFPQIKDNVETVSVFYPDDFKDKLGSDGIYGYSQTPDFSGVKRFSNITSIKGLYLTGKDTFPGAGYPSVIISGDLAAERICNE